MSVNTPKFDSAGVKSNKSPMDRNVSAVNYGQQRAAHACLPIKLQHHAMTSNQVYQLSDPYQGVSSGSLQCLNVLLSR